MLFRLQAILGSPVCGGDPQIRMLCRDCVLFCGEYAAIFGESWMGISLS